MLSGECTLGWKTNGTIGYSSAMAWWQFRFVCSLAALAGAGQAFAADADIATIGNWRTVAESDLCKVEGTNRFTGTVELRRDDGSLMRRLACVGGEKAGIDRQFHKNGVLAMERSWKAGQLDGLYRHWSDDGVLLEQWTYGPEGLEGDYYVYHPNGQPAAIAGWHRGKRHGRYWDYDRDGRLTESGTYVNGRPDGPVVSYKRAGGIGYRHYAMGTRVGTQWLRGSEGTLLRWTEYTADGQFVRRQVWNVDGSPIRSTEPMQIDGYGRGLKITEYDGCQTRIVIQSGTDDPAELAQIGYSLTPGLYRLERIYRGKALVERIEAFDHELLAPPFHAEDAGACGDER